MPNEDKSIRPHYQTGDKVKKLGYDVGQKLMSPLKDKYIAQDTGKIKKGQIAKDIGISFAKKAVARKLGVASLNPILGLLSLMGIDPISWLSKKMTEGATYGPWLTSCSKFESMYNALNDEEKFTMLLAFITAKEEKEC